MTRWILPAVILGGNLLGCTSFHPVETTPEAIVRSIEPGDTVRIALRDGAEITALVLSLSESELRTRTVDRSAARLVIRFDRIDRLDVERLDMRRAVLTGVLPALIAMAVVCERQECRTHAVVTSTD
jgi:hypothetical protein